MLADYHLHSEFSDDSDHVDYGIKQDWDEPGEIGWRHGDGVGTPRDRLHGHLHVRKTSAHRA